MNKRDFAAAFDWVDPDYLSRDPMFPIINTIVLVGLVTTAVGTVLQRRELLA